MAHGSDITALTGHAEFDSAIARFSDIDDPARQETARQKIWDEFGTVGAVFISDMASFSSTSRKIGVCHFLKMIHRARQIIAPLITDNNGLLMKCDADNCYAYFERTDDAIQASFDINAALFESNDKHSIAEQIYVSVGIDYGRGGYLGQAWVEWFGIGYASHLLGDAMTADGIPLWSPFSSKRVSLSNMRTGSRAEYAVAVGLLLFTCVFGWGLLPERVKDTHRLLYQTLAIR